MERYERELDDIIKRERVLTLRRAWVKRMRQKHKKGLYRRRKRRAQTMMEYIILVALVAVGSIPILTTLGNVFRDRVIHAADKMVDNKGGYSDQGAQLVQQSKEKVRRSMGNFHR